MRAPSPARRARRALLAAVIVAATATMTACQPMELVNDNRLSFTAPAARSHVTLPVTVTWRMRDFTPTGLDGSTAHSHGVFAVFVDTTPIKVGQTVKAVAAGDQSCSRDPRCPDATYLAERGVYVTTTPSVTLKSLPTAGDATHTHSVTVILLDGTGHRFSESAWLLSFIAPAGSGTAGSA